MRAFLRITRLHPVRVVFNLNSSDDSEAIGGACGGFLVSPMGFNIHFSTQ
ncbi:hypothetical protein A2U01_0076549, partial [Trifolium medium]|nr:hypothetical protein [Trifolium medium]